MVNLAVVEYDLELLVGVLQMYGQKSVYVLSWEENDSLGVTDYLLFTVLALQKKMIVCECYHLLLFLGIGLFWCCLMVKNLKLWSSLMLTFTLVFVL